MWDSTDFSCYIRVLGSQFRHDRGGGLDWWRYVDHTFVQKHRLVTPHSSYHDSLPMFMGVVTIETVHNPCSHSSEKGKPAIIKSYNGSGWKLSIVQSLNINFAEGVNKNIQMKKIVSFSQFKCIWVIFYIWIYFGLFSEGNGADKILRTRTRKNGHKVG